MSAATATPPLQHDVRVISLIGVAHGVSHYYQLAFATMLLIVVRDMVTRGFSVRLESSTIAFYAALTVMLSGFVLGGSEVWRRPDSGELALLLLSAGFLTVGYLSAVATMRVGEISFVAPFRYTSLIWAILLGLGVFGEGPDLWTWAGSALVVGAGMYLGSVVVWPLRAK